MKQNGKIKENAGPVDKLISVITYIVFALFSLICIYPFYYIFINTLIHLINLLYLLGEYYLLYFLAISLNSSSIPI